MRWAIDAGITIDLILRDVVAVAREAAGQVPNDNPAQFTDSILALITAGDVSLDYASNEEARSGQARNKIINPATLALRISDLINNAPNNLNTLGKLATAINDNPNFSTFVTNELAKKAPIASPEFSGSPSAPTPPPGDNSKKLATTAFVSSLQSGAPTGMIGMFATTTVPTGWLKCKGQALSRQDYAALFAVIGVTFGDGDERTTFNVPDLRGQFVRGHNEDNTGDDRSRELGSVQAGQNVSHNHSSGSYKTDTTGSHTHSQIYESHYVSGGGSGAGTPAQQSQQTRRTGSGGSHSHDVTGSSGSAGGSENRPKNIALAYFIKT